MENAKPITGPDNEIAKPTVHLNTFYSECCQTYRFFKGWRHALFAGLFLVLAAVGTFCLTASNEDRPLIVFILIAAGFIPLLLFALDVRTRTLFQLAKEEGAKMEGAAFGGSEVQGFFTRLSKDEGSITHGRCMAIACVVSMVMLLGLAAWFLFH